MLMYGTIFSHVLLHLGYISYCADAQIAALHAESKAIALHTPFRSFENVYFLANVHASRPSGVYVKLFLCSVKVTTSSYGQG